MILNNDLVKYYGNGKTSSSGYPEFELDSHKYNIIGFVSHAGDFVFENTDSYNDTYCFMLQGTMSYQIAGEGAASTDLKIIAYTC